MKEGESKTYSGAHGLYWIMWGYNGWKEREVGRLLGEWADLQELRRSAEEGEQKDILDKLFSLGFTILQKTRGISEAGEEVKELITPIEARCHDCDKALLIGKEEAERVLAEAEEANLWVTDIELVCTSCGERYWEEISNKMDALVARCKTLASKL